MGPFLTFFRNPYVRSSFRYSVVIVLIKWNSSEYLVTCEISGQKHTSFTLKVGPHQFTSQHKSFGTRMTPGLGVVSGLREPSSGCCGHYDRAGGFLHFWTQGDLTFTSPSFLSPYKTSLLPFSFPFNFFLLNTVLFNYC